MACNADVEVIRSQIRTIEILKLRFGEVALQGCEVMLKDMADSRRTNQSIQASGYVSPSYRGFNTPSTDAHSSWAWVCALPTFSRSSSPKLSRDTSGRPSHHHRSPSLAKCKRASHRAKSLACTVANLLMARSAVPLTPMLRPTIKSSLTSTCAGCRTSAR